MNVAPPSIPLHVARAYGVTQAIHESRAASHSPTRPLAPSDRLIARVVPGQIEFAPSGAADPARPIPMYRHPSDRNAAATGIEAGRVVDVSG